MMVMAFALALTPENSLALQNEAVRILLGCEQIFVLLIGYGVWKLRQGQKRREEKEAADAKAAATSAEHAHSRASDKETDGEIENRASQLDKD